MTSWAIDIGTTNSLVARWNSGARQPEVVALLEIARQPTESSASLQPPSLVPSCVLFPARTHFIDRLGAHPFFIRRFFLGRMAVIGQPAIDRWFAGNPEGYVPVFKPYLGRESLRTAARAGRRAVTIRQAALAFLRELAAAATRATGERPRDVVFTTPVDSYEPYRAELQAIAEGLGIGRVRTLDEPVAAAIGYGLGRGSRSTVLAVNFGGGTYDTVVMELDAESVSTGRCRVIAKDGIAMGGNLVDAWLVEEFCARIGHDLKNTAFADDEAVGPRTEWWYQALLREACRVKESLYARERERFLVIPPRDILRLAAAEEVKAEAEFTRAELMELLARNGLYRAIDESIGRALQQAAAEGVSADEIDDVVLVGGSTLLPEVFPRIAERFGRERIRAWQPFEAVVYGGCLYGAGAIERSDVILHDYALVTYDRKTHEQQYQIIVPKGTRAPTASAIWKRHLTPTCPLGEPERVFKLVICEVGRAHSDHRHFIWDQSGRLQTLNAGSDKTVVVPLNESDPVLGYLDPPHDPRDRAARLEVSFAVNAERWLTASVLDLRTRHPLMDDEPIVRLQ